MAARVNVKLVVILLLVLVGAGGIAGALFVAQMLGDASRNARIGDKFFAEGDLNAARDHYARALRKEPGNREYLNKYENVLLMLTPATADRARELYDQQLIVLRHAAQHFQQNADDHMRLLEELHMGARLSQSGWPGRAPQFFELLEAAATNMIDRVALSDPKREYGRLYKSIARFNLRAAYSPEDIENTENDLKVFLDAHPDSDLGWATLIISQWTTSVELGLEGETRRSEEKRAEADANFRRALPLFPEGIEFAKARVLDLYYRTDIKKELVPLGEVEDIFGHLLDLVNTDQPEWTVSEAMRFLQRAGSPALRTKAKSVLAAYIKDHDTNPVLRMQLAKLYFDWSDFEDSEQQLQALLDAEELNVSLMAEFQFVLKRVASGMLNDIAYQRWATAATAEEKAQTLTQLKRTRDQVRRLLSENTTQPLVLRADAQLAFAEGDYVTAVQKFEQLLKNTTSIASADLYYFAVYCHQQLGNVGLALERIKQAIELRPDVVSFYAKKAEIEVGMRRFDSASATAAEGLKIDPENEVLLRIQQLGKAGGKIEDIEDADPVVKAVSRAQTAAREGDMDQARATLLAQLELTPDNVSLLSVLARFELFQNEREKAKEYITKAIALEPESKFLQQQREQIENEDAIEMIQNLALLQHGDDKAEIAASMVVGMMALSDRETNRASALEQSGDTAGAAASRALAERAGVELKRNLAEADRLAPDHPAVIEYHLRDAMITKNWSKAEQYIEKAGKLNLDKVGGDMYRARYQIVRERYSEAVRTMVEVTAKMDFSAVAWRTLAFAYEQLGNFNEAARAYDRAYGCDPTRLDTIRSYVRLLLQTGETARALEVVRNARLLAQDDASLREVWLDLEADAGDSVVALRERRAVDKKDPNNRMNMIRLAMLLSRLEPRWQLMLDDAGVARYTDRSWNLLSLADRTAISQRTREQWQLEADAIVKRLADSGLNDLQFAALRAQMLRTRGNVAGGEKVLKDYIDAQPEDQKTAEMYVYLGNYLSNAARNGEALEAFQQGLAYQDDTDRPVDIALGNLHFRLGDRQSALRHFQRATEKSKNRVVTMRMIECLVELGRLTDAEKVLDDAEKEGGVDFTTLMLRSAVAEEQGQKLLEQGNDVEAKFRFDVFAESLSRAQLLHPRDVLPKLRLAKRYFDSYRLIGKRELLDESLRVLAAADQITANDPRVSLVRVDILREMNDKNGAMAELQRLLERSPNENRARSLLVAFYIEDKNADAAIEVVQAGIRTNETVAIWHIQLGDLYLNMKKDPKTALEAYGAALALEQSPALVGQIAKVMLNSKESPARVLEFLSKYTSYLETEPVVIGVYAKALSQAGRTEDTLKVLRTIYANYDAMIDQGSLDESAISVWFRVAREVIPAVSLAQIETLLMELCGNKPNAFELSSLSFLYRSTPGDSTHGPKALELQKRAIELIGNLSGIAQSPYYYDLGSMLIEAGDLNAAVDAFEKCTKLNPDHALAYNNYAYLLCERMNDCAKALPMAEKSVKLQPDNPAILDTVGWINFRVGNLEQAEEYLRRSIKFEEAAPTYVHLGEVLAARNECERAINGPLRRAQELMPDDQTKAEIARVLELCRTKAREGK